MGSFSSAVLTQYEGIAWSVVHFKATSIRSGVRAKTLQNTLRTPPRQRADGTTRERRHRHVGLAFRWIAVLICGICGKGDENVHV